MHIWTFKISIRNIQQMVYKRSQTVPNTILTFYKCLQLLTDDCSMFAERFLLWSLKTHSINILEMTVQCLYIMANVYTQQTLNKRFAFDCLKSVKSWYHNHWTNIQQLFHNWLFSALCVKIIDKHCEHSPSVC